MRDLFPERDPAVRTLIAATILVVIWAIAGGVWGLAVHGAVIGLALAGAVQGLALGLFGRSILARRRTVSDASQAQAMAGAIFGLPGIALGALGAIVWLARTVLFH